MRRILLVLTVAAVMLVLVASSVSAKPNKTYCAVAPIPGTSDSLVACNSGKQDCKERVAALPNDFGKCTKGFPDPS